MKNSRKNLPGALSALTVGAVVVVVAWTAYAVFVDKQTHIYAENGLLENVQAIVLAMACLTFLASATWQKRPDTLVLLSCSLLCYTFVLRELDVERLDVPEALKFIGSGVGRNVTLAAAFIAIFSRAAFRAAHYKNIAVCFLRSPAGALLMTGGAFLLLGDVAEKFDAVTHHVYFEEVLELLGYALMLLSAFAASSYTPCTMNVAGGPADAGPCSGQ